MAIKKSSHKVVSLLLAIALVLTMFVTVAPTNVLATGASGESGNIGESGTELIQIETENLNCDFASTSAYYNKAPYEVFIVGETLPTFTPADFVLSGTGSENCTITNVVVCEYRNGAFHDSADTTTVAGKIYYVLPAINANEGYELANNGTALNPNTFVNEVWQYFACINSSNEIVYVRDDMIWHRNTNLPTYKAGEALPTAISNENNKAFWIENPELCPFTISDTIVKVMKLVCVEADGTTIWGYTGDKTFVAGETYALAYVLEPKDGYTFNDEEASGFYYWFDGFDGKVFVYLHNLEVCPAATDNVANGQIQGSVDLSEVINVDGFDADDKSKQIIQEAINNATAELELSVSDITLTVPAEDKTAVDAVKGEKQIKKYFDIDLNLVIGNYNHPVTELAQPITISLTIDRNLTGVETIRVHNGVVEALPTTYNPMTGVLTFETDKFSTYVLAYENKTVVTPTIVGGVSTHIHTYKYSFSKDGHWQNCSCGLDTIEEKHSFNSQGVCECGYNKNGTSTSTSSSQAVANPSTGGNGSVVFIIAILLVLAVFGTTNIVSRKKYSK